MLLRTTFLALFAMAFMAVTPAHAISVGEMAPEFTASDSDGNTQSLANHRGKYVVLEWTNHECPYVEKHYNTGNMQALQQRAKDEGIVWLTVLSSAPGKQGYTDLSNTNALREKVGDKSMARVLDPTGEVGQKYNAKTTPHMFVIDPEGKLIYAGAIDSNSSSDPDTIKTATNYIAEVMDAIKNGTDIKVAQTTPYGCSIKY